jgi:outer membrane protein OmpA-like peptidoglycan-associated protein
MKDRQSKILVFSRCILMVLLVGSFMGGCASIPEKNEALDNARAAYEKAQADPDVKANAPVALYEAGQELKRAEQAKDVEEMNHLAYIAEKKAQIAASLAEEKRYEKDLESLSQEKDKIVLQAREQEVQRVKREADMLAQQAEKARREAEARAIEIERAKGKAEVKALEAEQARKEAEARALELEKARKEAEAKTLEAQMAKVQTEQAVEKRKELESELEELKAKRSERGIVLTLGDILFETGKANLMPGAMRTIDHLAEFLQKHSERNVLIEGHTDSVGTELYNLGLSQRRADSVKTALIARGISPTRVMTKGYGEQYPIASNDTSAGRQQNRRVEIIILEEGVSPEKALR